ncbi:Adenylate cyclase, class 3 [Janibacter indicus]|uniref:Adenylate cyclase, class 3 n=2 Tax=Janibacter indicus TaxID=857417 RepID=A0A1W2BFL8_9MICO|nr:Adenylate cyclase, class 3 [Janibacter indicus]
MQKSTTASAALETKALGHPDYETLDIGERRTAPMVTVFLDLTNFTGRTFWDDQDEVVDLAHAVLSGFVEVVNLFGGHPLGLRGDGLFAGFSPGQPEVTGAMALAACAFALDGIEREVNPWLDGRRIARIQARAGLDYGQTTFVRSGSRERSEINPLGFAANFAAKCEKKAKSWEIVVGQGLRELLPEYPHFVEHHASPKTYTRDYKSRLYRFYDYRWRNTLPLLPGVLSDLNGTPTSLILTK